MDSEIQGDSRRRLTLWDTISVIIGIVIGAGIFETPPLVLKNVPGPWTGLGAWALGGLLSLMGALTYAELASTYPRSGGAYVYLTRAYGSWAGFLFGWAQLAVIITSSIGMLAYVFADYAVQFGNSSPDWTVWFAAAAILALSGINIIGVMIGKTAQNVMSLTKVIGLAGVIIAGVWVAVSELSAPHPESTPPVVSAAASVDAAGATTSLPFASLASAMVLVFLTYGGWSDAAFFVAEMQQPRKIVRALILGTAAITVIYLLVNSAYIMALGFHGARQSSAVASDVVGQAMGPRGASAMSLLVMISTLGALNGLIFAGSRLYATLGDDHSVFAWLGRWHPRLHTPVCALVAQAAISLAMAIMVGSRWGQAALDSAFQTLGMESVPWDGRHGFETLLRCTAPVFWLFFLLVSVSLFVLRYRDPRALRPFVAPLYPLCPLIFSATCAYMLYAGVNYAGRLGLTGGARLLAGVPVYLLSSGRGPQGRVT